MLYLLQEAKTSHKRSERIDQVSAYQCPEGKCYAVFEKLDDLEVHMEVGEHKNCEGLGLYDKLKLDWVSKFTELTFEEHETTKQQYSKNMGSQIYRRAGHFTNQKVGARDFQRQSKTTSLQNTI